MFLIYIVPVIAFIGFYFSFNKFKIACIASFLFNISYLLFLGIIVLINQAVHTFMGV